MCDYSPLRPAAQSDSRAMKNIHGEVKTCFLVCSFIKVFCWLLQIKLTVLEMYDMQIIFFLAPNTSCCGWSTVPMVQWSTLKHEFIADAQQVTKRICMDLLFFVFSLAWFLQKCHPYNDSLNSLKLLKGTNIHFDNHIHINEFCLNPLTALWWPRTLVRWWPWSLADGQVEGSFNKFKLKPGQSKPRCAGFYGGFFVPVPFRVSHRVVVQQQKCVV